MHSSERTAASFWLNASGTRTLLGGTARGRKDSGACDSQEVALRIASLVESGVGNKESFLKFCNPGSEGRKMLLKIYREPATRVLRDVAPLTFQFQQRSDSTAAPRTISLSSAIATEQPRQHSRYSSPSTALALFSAAVLYATKRRP